MSKLLLLLLLLGLICVLFVHANDAAEGAESPDVVDAEEEEEEEEEINLHPGFTDEEWAEVEATAETHEFQAEVTRLMDIIINSLYSNREIFLRELISNSADALDKIRYKSITAPELLGEGDAAELEIRISFDKDAKTLTIRDRGVGMTQEDLRNNLGTVARSGTTEFVEAATGADNGDSDTLSLIGQFGVGFYSVYLVAEKVVVASKHNDDVQHVWESNADQSYTISVDPRGNTLDRGTEITMHLREDAEEFLNDNTLNQIVKRYSQFVNYPIYLRKEKKVQEDVPIDDEEELADLDIDLDELNQGEEGEEPLPPRTERVEKIVIEWERVNDVKAIWTRAPSDISEEEYNAFYRTLLKERDVERAKDPLTRTHFKAEGEISFRSIMFVPFTAASDLYTSADKKQSIKLYVRRVLISDEFEEFLPNYLKFIKGVVDSDDLPLNVSRETLAQNRVLRVMAKKLTRKVIEMLRRMAEEDEEDEEEDEIEDSEVDETDSEEEEEESGPSKYIQFWEEFGKSIKLGVIDDKSNKAKLSKLLRFKTTKSDDEWISLEDYVDNMADDQKHIYYITGESIEVVSKSPLLETAKNKDYEVIYMTDAIDEYLTQHMTEFDGNPLASVAKEGLSLGEDDIDVDGYTTYYKEFTAWIEESLGKKVQKVGISTRLSTSPCIIVTSQYGWTANMERIMKAQTFADGKSGYMAAQKTLEINPRHPLVVQLKERYDAEGDTEELTDLVDLMYDAALVQSGFTFGEPDEFAARIARIMGAALEVDPEGNLIDIDLDSMPEPSDDDHEHDEL